MKANNSEYFVSLSDRFGRIRYIENGNRVDQPLSITALVVVGVIAALTMAYLLR